MNNYKKVKIILSMILALNLLVAISKMLVGFYVNSSSVIADAMHSFTDSLSNIVGLIGVIIASKPHDREHPYGHSKFEVLSSLFIGVMLVFVGFEVILSAAKNIGNNDFIYITKESLIILIATLLINIFISVYEYRQGKKLNSCILISDSIHTRSDIFISIGVILTLIFIKLGAPVVVDKIISLVVAVFILHSAYEVFKEAISVLVDKAVVSEDEIKNIIEDFADIRDIHKIRSRGSRQNLYIDMHIMVDYDMTVEKSHKLNHDLENRIKEVINENAQVIVHLEPYYKK